MRSKNRRIAGITVARRLGIPVVMVSVVRIGRFEFISSLFELNRLRRDR